MRSPHSAVPAVTLKLTPGGWLVACSKGCQIVDRPLLRPTADQVAEDHRKSHAPRRVE